MSYGDAVECEKLDTPAFVYNVGLCFKGMIQSDTKERDWTIVARKYVYHISDTNRHLEHLPLYVIEAEGIRKEVPMEVITGRIKPDKKLSRALGFLGTEDLTKSTGVHETPLGGDES